MAKHAARTLGVNVIGVLSTGTGFGSAGRSTLRVLARRNIAHAAVDLALSGHHIVEPVPDSAAKLDSLAALPYAVSVFQLSPDAFDVMVLRWAQRSGLDLATTVNAIVPFWELPSLPANWIPLLQLFDVVLAPTAFVRDAITASMPEELRPIILDYPQTIAVPGAVVADRERWFGAHAGKTVFLSSFDIRADIERKNPWAAIEAFQKAFEDRDDAALVVKVSNANTPRRADQFARLSQFVAADARVTLMTEHLSRDDLASLSASADVYVSLHRAEGLGFGMLEAMAVGTPVVATGWSGNVDFMDETNSISIPYALLPMSGATQDLYASESHQSWAEPDIDAAAGALRSLADSPELRRRLGAAAKLSMQERWDRQSEPGVFDELIALAESGLANTAQHVARVDAATRYVRKQTLAPSNLLASAKRGGVQVLRRIGIKPPAPADEYRWGPPDILT